MKVKISFRKPGIVFGLTIVLSLLINATAHAQTNDPIVELFRLGGSYAGVKITFPTEINGRFLVMVAGKGFDCEVTSANSLYCTGPYSKGTGPSTLFLIDLDTKEVILQRDVYPPVPKGYGIPELLPSDYLSAPPPSGGGGGSTPPPGGPPTGGSPF